MFYYGPENQLMKLETGAFLPTRMGVTSDKLEPMLTKMAAYKNSVPKTTYVLDGVLDPSVVTPLNVGLQSIPLGAATAAQVAAEMQKTQDVLLKKK
jgi:ABC-type glycerol-3-phosphate transport system substrate-binding protein